MARSSTICAAQTNLMNSKQYQDTNHVNISFHCIICLSLHWGIVSKRHFLKPWRGLVQVCDLTHRETRIQRHAPTYTRPCYCFAMLQQAPVFYSHDHLTAEVICHHTPPDYPDLTLFNSDHGHVTSAMLKNVTSSQRAESSTPRWSG